MPGADCRPRAVEQMVRVLEHEGVVPAGMNLTKISSDSSASGRRCTAPRRTRPCGADMGAENSADQARLAGAGRLAGRHGPRRVELSRD